MSTTNRLYYNDPALRAFDATVTRCEVRSGQLAVWLDRTAFYPTSGGQPFDTGAIAGATVVDVQEDADGDVVHLLDASAIAVTVGAVVHAQIDWARRRDHMQQHTGQHVLSAVLERTCQARTVSFHLGSDESTIDIDRELTAGQCARGEAAANQAVWDDLPVDIRYASEEEARALPLRKEPTRSGVLRLIEISGLDLSACGGTHVPRTGAIGQISIASRERFKGGQRIAFLCGGRALARFQQLRDTSDASTKLLSVLPQELPAAIERLQGELKEQKRLLGTAQLELAKYEAIALADGAEAMGGGRLVLRAVDGDAARLKALASATATRAGTLVILVSTAAPAVAVAARAADVDVPCHEIIAALAKDFSGRGGGKPDLAQCGGLQGSVDAILAAARTLVAGRI
jgi:alanyl-tRNA synthetase